MLAIFMSGRQIFYYLINLETMNKLFFVSLSILVFSLFSCRKETILPSAPIADSADQITFRSLSLTENFEAGTKTSYATADIALSTGSWNFNDALIGTSGSDPKTGLKSARVRNSGRLSMNFDFPNGAGTVTVSHAKFGSDPNGTWQLWQSTNGGATYTQVGSTVTTSTTTLATASFTVNLSGNIRFQIRKTDAGTNRINFDNFVINEYASGGNASPALSSIAPSSTTAGSPSFTLTANGSNFINGSFINWNGTALTTTFVSSTVLTATVPAANIANAGTATVTVFTPAPGGGTSGGATFTINPAGNSTVKRFLFDASQAETAGNADWVIDEDSNIPVMIPTPAQSNITASTPETYWTGALSSWGISLVKAGNYVETLPAGTSITYGTSAPQDLSHYDVFVVDEPNTVFTAAEKTAILNFVSNGGGLFMVADHTMSDRNNDGWDSPAIWNDLMTNNSIQSNPFGFSVDLTTVSEVSSNVLTNSSSNPILNGSQGPVTQLQFNKGATLTLQPNVNASVKGLIWRNTYAQSTTNVMCASSEYGTGRVFMVTDSSPTDDGTGTPTDVLHVGWPNYSHSKLFMNASLWLAKLQ